MVNVINAIQLLNGIILSKTDLTGEVLVRVNKKNIFLDEKLSEENNNEYFWLIILPDKECHWEWFYLGSSSRSKTGSNAFAFYRQGDSKIVEFLEFPSCIASLIKAQATISPEDFIPKIEELGEVKIVEELEKIAIRYGR